MSITKDGVSYSSIVENNLKRFHFIARSYAEAGETKDLLQEILLQVWKSLQNFKGSSKIDTWVYRIALNTAISYMRASKRRPVFETEIDLDELVGENSLAESSEAEILESFIASLNRIDRAVLILYLENMNYEQIAEVLGMNTNQLGVRINRIKSLFKNRLTEV